MRDRLADWIDKAKYAKDVAPLMQRLADVIEKLQALPDPARESTVDELAAARDARRAAARSDPADLHGAAVPDVGGP